jgi:hypothetical protein
MFIAWGFYSSVEPRQGRYVRCRSYGAFTSKTVGCYKHSAPDGAPASLLAFKP